MEHVKTAISLHKTLFEQVEALAQNAHPPQSSVCAGSGRIYPPS